MGSNAPHLSEAVSGVCRERSKMTAPDVRIRLLRESYAHSGALTMPAVLLRSRSRKSWATPGVPEDGRVPMSDPLAVH